jgi:hypothetical protein
MSFDLPANIERDLERYAQSLDITPAEAALKIIQSGLKASNRTGKNVLITDSDLDEFYEAFPGFKSFEDVTDEQWGKVLRNSRRMNKQGLSVRG